MLGGKHAYLLGQEEYIFAALNLYIDIIILFRFILGMGRSGINILVFAIYARVSKRQSLVEDEDEE